MSPSPTTAQTLPLSGASTQARAMLAFLVLAQLADAGTFLLWVSANGVLGEANPFAVVAYERLGIEGLLVLKGVAILAVLALLVASAGRFQRVFHMGSATATSLGLLGVVTNVTALLVT